MLMNVVTIEWDVLQSTYMPFPRKRLMNQDTQELASCPVYAHDDVFILTL